MSELKFIPLRAGATRKSPHVRSDDTLEQVLQSLTDLRRQVDAHAAAWLDLFLRTNDSRDPFLHGLSGETLLLSGQSATATNKWTDSYLFDGADNPRTMDSLCRKLSTQATTMSEQVELVRAEMTRSSEKVRVSYFTDLVDTPDGYAPGQYPAVNSAVDGLEATSTVARKNTFTSLLDTPASIAAANNQYLKVSPTGHLTAASANTMWPHTVISVEQGQTLSGDQLDRTIVYITRNLSGYTLSLGEAEDGAFCTLLLRDTGGGGLGDITVQAGGGVTLEEGPVTLNGSRRYVSLFYVASNATFYISQIG